MKITKIILFFVSFILSFLLFTKDTFAERYDYDISKFVFNPVNTDKLIDWVPTDIEKFIYKNPFLKTRATIWPGKITTKAITYLTYVNFSDNKSAINFKSITPFFAIVNPKYLNSEAKIGIPITPDVVGWDAQYIYITPDQDEYWNTCLFLESPNWKVKEIMKNTCFDNFHTQEPFLMIFSINHHYKLNNGISNFSMQEMQQDWVNYTSIEYTLTRRAWKSPWQKEEPISLYKPDSIKLDPEDYGDEFIWGRLLDDNEYQEYDYNSDLCYKNWFKQWCSLKKSKYITDFKRQGGQRFIQFYSYEFEKFPGKGYDEAGWWLYSNDKENEKAQFYQFFPIKDSFLLDQLAPFVVEQAFGEPKHRPDGKWYDFTPGQNNDGEWNQEKWPFKIPKFNMEKPQVPTCSFSDSFLGLSCLGEWMNYGFSMIVWVITSVIDAIIDFLNFIIEFCANFFNSFFEIFQKFALWLWDKIATFFKAFFEGLIYSIVEVAKEIWSVFASVWNFIKVLFGDWSMYTFLAQNDKLSCGENWVYDYSWSLAIPGVIPGTKAHQVISPILQTFALAVPSIPHDGDVICTFAGYQRIKYKGNSPIDLILVMIFSFAILFLFTKRYGSSQ